MENNTVLGGMRTSTMKTQHSNVKNVVSVLVIDIRCKDTRKNTLRRSVHSVLNVASDMAGKVTSRNCGKSSEQESDFDKHQNSQCVKQGTDEVVESSVEVVALIKNLSVFLSCYFEDL